MEQQTFYKEDSFGLKTLHSEQRLKLIQVDGIGHRDWTLPEVFIKYVAPLLD